MRVSEFICIFAFKALQMDLSQIDIYRMTHIKNIPHILEHGVTHKKSLNANPDYVTIADTSLINTRLTKIVKISNGNRNQFYGNIILGDFIPFYFGVRMPMLYVVQLGGNYVKQAFPAEDIIYLVCKLSEICQADIKYFFSDRHAVDAFALFYNSSKIAELPAIINWDAVKAPYWGGEKNLETKKLKEAEFLVADDIPVKYLHGFICFNEAAKQSLIDIGIDTMKIKIDYDAYYKL